jgi:hypothetical protein
VGYTYTFGNGGGGKGAGRGMVLGSLSGIMNSWFYHEFTLFSMGSISVNIMKYGKIDYGHVGHGVGVGEWYNSAVRNSLVGRSWVSIRASTIGLIVRCGVLCVFFLLA